MKVTIMRDEKYPVYSLGICTKDDIFADVPEETVILWKAVIANYQKVQDEMEKIFKRIKSERVIRKVE